MAKDIPIIPLFLTKDKKQEIIDEIENITNKLLPEIRVRLATAFEDGDIPENNPFITAHEDLQLAMKRLNELRELLMRAKAYKPSKMRGIKLGDTVSISLNNLPNKTFILVEPEESDPTTNKLSTQSPYGKAVMGKKKGDKIIIITPRGNIHGKIV